MYEFMICCIVAFLWFCGSVFSFVSYIVTHKIRKIPALVPYDCNLPALLGISLIGSPILGVMTWLSCLNYVIQSKFKFTDKINEWTSK